MTTPTTFSCPAVALRVFGIAVLSAMLFLLDRIVLSSVGLDYSRIQSITLYLWLVGLPLVGYSWVLSRCHRLASASPMMRWLFAIGIASGLSVASAIGTLALIWISP